MTNSYKLAFVGLGLIAGAAMFGATNAEFRDYVQRKLNVQGREVLATAEGDLLNDGSLVKVIKYRGTDGIFVEIFKTKAGSEEAYSLVDKIDLPDKHDGLFNFHGHVTRLAITDVDGNGSMELLAPTFDAQLVPHLNIFKYNSTLGKFEAMQPPENP
jgi:hypothetical protein